MRTKITIIVAFILAVSSCQKQSLPTPFWNEQKKFEFQQTSYMHSDGNSVEIISLGAWEKNAPNETSVKIFTGITGGQQSFTDITPALNFLYITDSIDCKATYNSNSLKRQTPAGQESIEINTAGEIQSTGTNLSFDYRKITSITFHGKTFMPINADDYFIARKDEIGQTINRLVTEGKQCSFTSCVNGTSSDIQWYYDGSEVSIIANGGSFTVSGVVVGSKFSTPMLVTKTGDVYIIQFYTMAKDSNQVACSCTMNFKLYKVTSPKSTITKPQFQLIIGNC